MAFAGYFSKNVQAAALLLQGIDPEAFKTVLKGEIVGIAFDKASVSSPEGQATLDLAVRLLARLYPTLALIGLDEAAKKKLTVHEALARSINSKIGLHRTARGVTRCIVLGKSRPRFQARSKPFVIYVGSNGWLTRISTKAPVGSGTTKNPFGAGGAACIGVANVFRSTFSKDLPRAKPDTNARFSILDMAPAGSKVKNPQLKSLNLGEVHLAGAGAIGNGFLWAVSRLRCFGTLHVVDGENLESSNLQRYVMTAEGDEGKTKVELAKAWLADSKLMVNPHAKHWEMYVAARNDWRFERVAVSVDKAHTRITIQAALPRTIFNSWTQAGEAGVSRHGFLGPGACLACLYLPDKEMANHDQLIARALRLPETEQQLLEIRRRLDLAVPTERAFLQAVATATSIPLERLLPFEGKLLEAFYIEAVCGGAVMELASGQSVVRMEVPMAFQSAFAGILLAGDLVAECARLRRRLPTKTQINLLTALPLIPSNAQLKAINTKCFCVDDDFIAAYRAKYENASGERLP